LRDARARARRAADREAHSLVLHARLDEIDCTHALAPSMRQDIHYRPYNRLVHTRIDGRGSDSRRGRRDREGLRGRERHMQPRRRHDPLLVLLLLLLLLLHRVNGGS